MCRHGPPPQIKASPRGHNRPPRQGVPRPRGAVAAPAGPPTRPRSTRPATGALWARPPLAFRRPHLGPHLAGRGPGRPPPRHAPGPHAHDPRGGRRRWLAAAEAGIFAPARATPTSRRAGGEGATGLRGAAGRPPTPCSGSGSRVYCHVCLPKRGQPTGRRAPATRRAPGCRWSPSFTVPAVRFHWRGDEPLPTHAHWAQRIAAKDNIPGRSAPALAASWAGRWRCRCARPAGADRGRPPRDGDEDV